MSVDEKEIKSINKARFWVGVCYTENMIDSWQDDISDIVQVPYSYCIHNKDVDEKGDSRKEHVHIILAFSNTTTYNHALKIFNLLSAENAKCANTCKAIINIRNMYNYIVHDTESCRKKGKFEYPVASRVCGNNFDIGCYEQIGLQERNAMCKELCDLIVDEGISNFGEFYTRVVYSFEDSNYFDILKSYSGLFERLTKSNFLIQEKLRKMNDSTF